MGAVRQCQCDVPVPPCSAFTLHRTLHDGRPVFLVLTGACQFGHGVGGFTTDFIHSAYVLCLSPPLVALLLTRLAIRSGQSHPGMYMQPHQPGSG